ncbi:MAG: hypothetical protein JNJ50_29395 [Acidobacteria bacterium]|nr:hypothetical protein [Acidobacteriota bacterium]
MDNYRSISPFTNVLPNDLFSGFIGRRKELAEIKAVFERGIRGLIILGIGGIGKTSLAWMAARQNETLFPGGIFSTSASWSESLPQLMNRILPSHSASPLLLVINDAEIFEEEEAAYLDDQFHRSPNLRLILTTRKDLPLLPSFYRVRLEGLNKEEFQELLQLRNAVAHNQLDDRLAERLFQLAGGNALFANLAAYAIKSGIVKSWRELFQYVRSYSTPGIVEPDGRPLTRESVEYNRIILALWELPDNPQYLVILERG